MYLINTGQTATDIRIDCSWTRHTKKLYVVSLSTNGYAYLPEVRIDNIAEKEDKLTLEITCIDSTGKKYTVPKIEIDLGQIKKEGRQLTYQHIPEESD